ncbi:Uncharacterized protein TCM_027448 [Theobroma cacao]|uniref:Uncharacterized protein n=1 Tax=Theobroma cacao TaxID=3641 RepID=A0A061G918_THECC|nr:Uncharacterized protein TCM_027448 [Theobroma cacao]
MEDQAEWGSSARVNRRNLKEKRTTSIKQRRTAVTESEEHSGLELMEERDDHGNHRRDMLELKASIQSLKDAIWTFEDRITGRILKDMILQGGASSHHDGDVTLQSVNAEANHVLQANVVVDAATEVDGTLNQLKLKETMFLRPMRLSRQLRKGMGTLN